MYIACENCRTRYLVKADSIGEAGRVVKCAKCGHKWHQNPPTEEEQRRIQREIASEKAVAHSGSSGSGGAHIPPLSEEARRIIQEHSVPATQEKVVSPASSWVKYAAVVLFVVCIPLGFLVFHQKILAHFPQVKPAYKMVGLAHESGVKLYDVQVSLEGRRANKVFMYGTLVNISKEPRLLKGIKITFFDEHKSKVGSDYIPNDAEDQHLAPFHKAPFKAPLKGVATSTRFMTVELDVGNGLELMLRKNG